MSWIDELETVLNNSTKEEFEKMWAKYNDFDCGPELDCFVGSSLQYYCVIKVVGKMYMSHMC